MKKTAIVALLALSSCASIVEGSKNKIEVSTAPPSQGTVCQLSNGLGSAQLSAPGSVTLHRSKTDVQIACSNATTGATGNKTVESDMEPWFLGNIVLGGIIGGGVDWATGDMWKYPNDVTVNLAGGQQPVVIQQVPVPVPVAPNAQPQTYQPTMVPSYPTGRQ